MSSLAQAVSTGAFSEAARYLPSGAETVFAVCTSPTVARGDLGVVLAHSGANNFSAHRNGVWTSLSRRLACEGFPSLRFDFAGTGESSGEFAMALAGQPVADATAAMDALREAGCRRLLVVGSCYGGIPAVLAGAGRPDVAGVILLSPPLISSGAGRMASIRERVREVVNAPTLRAVAANREYRRWFFARLASLARTRAAAKLRRLTTRTPVSGETKPANGDGPGRGLLIEKGLARLVTAGRHVEIVFGTGDSNLARVESDPEAWRAVRLLRDRRPAALGWTVLDGPVHGMEDIAVQEQLIRFVIGRAGELTGQPPVAAG